MSFVIDHFEDTSKWTENIVGTGSISNRTTDRFEATVLADADRAGLQTPIKHHLSELIDIRVLLNRNASRSGLSLAYEELEDPISAGFGYSIVRDSIYGIVVWAEGGAKIMLPDSVLPNEMAEVRITATQTAEGRVLTFYYNGELVYEVTKKTWTGEDFYVKLATAGEQGIAGTTTFGSVEYVPALTIAISPSETQIITTIESVLFTAEVRGGTLPYMVDWYVNDVNVASGTEFVFASAQIGTYTVHAVVTDSIGATAQSNIVTITVEEVPTPPPPSIAETKSEIRGIFVHCASWSGPIDWNLIAQTLQPYGIQVIYGEFLSAAGTYYDSDVVGPSAFGDQVAQAIAACHPLGIKVYATMDVMSSSLAKLELYGINAEKSDGSNIAWACPIRLKQTGHMQAMVEELVTKYDIDGFMFDYIRYADATTDLCYCSECRARFEEWLGEGEITDWTPFYPGGSRQNEFLDWRNIPVNELVRDMRNWMLAIKPNLQFTVAAWSCFSDCPIYWRKFLGQDTGDWIKNGYLDSVAPMMYTSDVNAFAGMAQDNLKYWVGEAEGKIPLLGFITTGVTSPRTPSEFKAIVDKCREVGLDGWIIWRYGGPGVDPVVSPDIRDYLSAIDLPTVFTLGNILVSAFETQATVTWETNLPATSKIEFSQSPLFTADWSEWQGFPYWWIKHIEGTIFEDITPKTGHSITLTGLTSGIHYYFRVQSKNGSGIATSKVYGFKTIGVASIITGKIIDQKTSNPIEGATVKTAEFMATSGADGTFILEVAPGTYNIKIEKTGYESVEIPDVDATTDVTFTEPIQLTPSPPPIIPPWLPWAFGLSLFGIGLVYVAREG